MFFTEALICAATVIVNITPVWTQEDVNTLMRAKKRCVEIYPKSPCVKKFVKVKSQVYRVVCTQEAK
jgi:hypothetical protein